MPWLLDTDVLSELSRTAPEQRVVDFIESCPLSELYVSTVTLAEIRFGIEQAAEPTRRDALNQWLEQTGVFEACPRPSF